MNTSILQQNPAFQLTFFVKIHENLCKDLVKIPSG